MATNGKQTFSEFIYNGLKKLIDINDKDYIFVRTVLDRVYGDFFDVQSFMEEFGFEKEDVLRFYAFVKNPSTYQVVQQFGLKSFNNYISARQAGITLN